MYPVSARYKELMRAQIRECTAHARIYIGVIDSTAAADATLQYSEAVGYSTPANVNADAGVTVSYLTFEPSRWRLDGAQQTLPDNTAALAVQGWISAAQSDADGVFANPPTIAISFSTTHSMAGLTLIFGDTIEDAPAQLTVLSYAEGTLLNTQVLTDVLTAAVCPAELLLSGVDKIVLRWDKTRAGAGRARLARLVFGIGYSYSDTDILQITERHTDAPVSTALPSSGLSFDLRNDSRFNVDSETALVRFFADGQEVQVDYGVTVDGAIEWVPGGHWYLSSWSTTGDKASFTATDKIDQLTKTTYEHGTYDFSWHNAYDRAQEVLADAAIMECNLDPAIKSAQVMAPLPIQTHAVELQLLANRACARLTVDRKGRVVIEQQTLTPSLTAPAWASTDRYTLYSDPASVLTGSTPYATLEPHYWRVDGSQKLLPEDTSSKIAGSGMTSKEIADSAGVFASKAALIWTANLATSTNVCRITMGFGGQTPAEVQLLAYCDGAWTTATVARPSADPYTVDVNYKHATKLEAIITKAQAAGQRGHFSAVSVSNILDVVLDGAQRFQSDDKAELATKLRAVTGAWTWRSYYPGSTEELVSTKLSTNSGWVRLEHGLAYNAAVVCTDTSVTVEATHYAYVSYVRLTSTTTKDVEIKITGYKMAEVQHPLSSTANDTGEDLAISNPLFDVINVQVVLDWMRSYYKRRVLRTIKTRGYPELDCGDYVYLDDGKAAQIIGTELSYTGAFNETFTLRGE